MLPGPAVEEIQRLPPGLQKSELDYSISPKYRNFAHLISILHCRMPLVIICGTLYGQVFSVKFLSGLTTLQASGEENWGLQKTIGFAFLPRFETR